MAIAHALNKRTMPLAIETPFKLLYYEANDGRRQPLELRRQHFIALLGTLQNRHLGT